MKLYEYEAKTILAGYNVAIPKGKVVTNSQEALGAAIDVGEPVAIKAQILVAGRGKAGGIKFAQSPVEAEKVAHQLLGLKIKDEAVTKLLVEQKLDIKRELYFAVTVDRFSRCYVAIASTAGGVDIEEIAEHQPQAIYKVLINPQQGFSQMQAKQLAEKLGYNGTQLLALLEIFENTYQAAMDLDAELVETNPLAEIAGGKFVAADTRITVDDNALFRHPQLAEKQLREQRGLSAQEIQAHKEGLEYIKLDGYIGVIGNGAGLVMATLDLISLYGGKAADFLDIGGGASAERIAAGLELLLDDATVKVILVNILGGITRCDQVAQAIVKIKDKQAAKPLVVRLMGTNEDEGKRILTQAGIATYGSMEQAAQKAVKSAQQQQGT